MDIAIGVILLVVAVIGLLMLLGSFGGLLYIIWRRGLENAAAGGGSGHCAGSGSRCGVC